uniref:Putative secreted protein n=1 Tax=Ixodes ricinus TaxID=34613 RepID=A0A6B0UE08_IXORI
MLRHSSRTPPEMCASAVSPSCLCLWCPSSSSLPSAPCSSARSGTDAGRFRASMSPRALLFFWRERLLLHWPDSPFGAGCLCSSHKSISLFRL